ncbi:MAG TPA: ribosome-associated translation inhibitor RaiA [Armatimonadota bacterium]|nr:ribosome-associated translation inhibitor RaiA [Armatimonadota bacterium]
MDITFTGKQFEVTDALRRYTERKLSKYEKQLRKLTSVHVVQSTERNWHNVDLTVTADGAVFRGEGRSDNMYTSIDLAVTRLETQIKHRKGKLIDRAHGRSPEARAPEAAVEGAVEADAEEDLDAEEAPRRVRTKRVQLTPMAVEEAIDEMEMLEQQFLVFVNGDSGRVNVVYRRDDGGYGLVDPDY